MDPILQLRREYSRAILDEAHTDDDPVKQFRKWFDEALEAKLPELNAMVLSTVSIHGRPAARIVLLRGIEADGFRFYTNYGSRKGQEISRSPYGALTFFWQELERQVRIEGHLEQLPAGDSDVYFAQRPRGSQLGAWASPQSARIASREELELQEQELLKQYEGKSVPRPPHWGGYCLRPDYIEFWQGRENRLHDRIVYQRENETWEKFRIAP